VGLAGLYLNLQGREDQGTVPPAEAAALRAEIAAGLRAIEDPEGGRRRPVRRVFDVHRVYDGPYLEDAPDLLVGYNRGYRASWETAQGTAGQQVVEDNVRHWSGDHCIDPQQVPGVLFSSQPLDRGRGPRLADLAPTVLEALGISRPPHMTGRSLLLRPEQGGEA
jgi:predicted AlkP superfamily phosphohydrolase/phosphomutase